MRVLNAAQMRDADRQTIDEIGIPSMVLMENAGRQVVAALEAAYDDLTDRQAAVLCGPGNNGGDGFVVARELYRAGVDVAVLPTKDEYDGDPATNLAILRNLGVRFVGADELEAELDGTDLVIDALLGTGFSGEVREREARLIEGINGYSVPVLVVDVP
jgi:ADP-dependent NAD(P)H-hydrate dehydratase / NAD(P)H-hydrate epimerase